MRAFIAVEIPAPIQHAIQQATAALRGEVGPLVRWAPPDNIHLTLKFLGDISAPSVEALTQILRAEADAHPALDIRIGGLGSFPSLRRVRVIYIGIQAPAGLEALHRGIESACARLGYESDNARGFSPHLTIGRVRQDVSASDRQIIHRALEKTTIDSLGVARVDSVQVYKSELNPSGAVYTRLFSAPLKN